MLASAVSRWRQKVSVPPCSEPSEHLDARLVERPAGVPDQVADAAKHVMDERPGEQKKHDAPQIAGEEVRDLRVGVRSGGNRDEPPGEQDKARGVRRA